MQPTEDSSDTENLKSNSSQVQSDDGIEKIKRKALDELLPVLDGLNVAPERKFEILLSASRYSYNEKLLSKTLDSALAINNPSVKADALIDLLGEIDFHQNSSSD